MNKKMKPYKLRIWKPLITILIFIHPQNVFAQYNLNRGSETYGYSRPCSGYQANNDDELVDFFKTFKLDFNDARFISKVSGTGQAQTAYRLEPEADLALPTRDIFPTGFPEEFSLICTMKNRKFPKSIWQLIRIGDDRNNPVFSITLNPQKLSLELTSTTQQGTLQTVSFPCNQIFDRGWHKIKLGVFRHEAVLYVDCERVGVETMLNRENVNIDGYTTLAKIEYSSSTATIELQKMNIYCDATKPERDLCEEIHMNQILPGYAKKHLAEQHQETSSISSKIQTVLTPSFRLNKGDKGEKGEPGEMGPPGPAGGFEPSYDSKSVFYPRLPHKGDKGDRGEPGYPGVEGLQGPKGDMGYIGPAGIPGRDGHKGHKGDPGHKGEPGRDGLSCLPYAAGNEKSETYNLNGYYSSLCRGSPGMPGARGPPGSVGMPGDRGLPGERGATGAPGSPGLPGSPGKSVPESEVRDICASILKEQLAEVAAHLKGPPGLPGIGRPGVPGLPGPKGHPGESGIPGQPGERGFVGFPGPQGPVGPIGPSGERGDKGDKGDDGIGIEGPLGPRGLPGLPGKNGVGLPGKPGDRGEPGRQGAPGRNGSPGLQGPPGFCQYCNYPYPNYGPEYPSQSNTKKG